MKLTDIARRIWRKFEALSYALDYEPHADLMSRVERLELDGQSRHTRMAALSEEVAYLSEQVPRLAGTRR